MARGVLAPGRYIGRYIETLPAMNTVAGTYVTHLPERVRVVIVDDDPFFRSLLKIMLQQAGLKNPQYYEAEDSDEALRLCREVPVELVFCDLNLPVLRSESGLAIVQELRQLAIDVPIYMVTADCEESLIQNVRAAGATGHILKPINLRILRRVLVASFLNGINH